MGLALRLSEGDVFRILAVMIALAFPAASTVGLLCDALCQTEAAATQDCHGKTPGAPHCHGAPVGTAPATSATDSDCNRLVSPAIRVLGSTLRIVSSFSDVGRVLSGAPPLPRASALAARVRTRQESLSSEDRSQLSQVLRI